MLAVVQTGAAYDGGAPAGSLSLLSSLESRASAVEIVDLKTSEKRPPLPQHQNQLRLHGKALSLLGQNPVRFTIHDLDSDEGHAIEVAPNDTELGEFEAEMVR